MSKTAKKTSAAAAVATFGLLLAICSPFSNQAKASNAARSSQSRRARSHRAEI